MSWYGVIITQYGGGMVECCTVPNDTVNDVVKSYNAVI